METEVKVDNESRYEETAQHKGAPQVIVAS